MLRSVAEVKMTFSDGHYNVVPIPDEHIAAPAAHPGLSQ